MNNLNGNRKNEFRRKQEEKQRKLALKIEDEAGELREGSLKSEEAIPSLDELCAMGERVEQQTTFSAKEAIRNKIKARRDAERYKTTSTDSEKWTPNPFEDSNAAAIESPKNEDTLNTTRKHADAQSTKSAGLKTSKRRSIVEMVQKLKKYVPIVVCGDVLYYYNGYYYEAIGLEKLIKLYRKWKEAAAEKIAEKNQGNNAEDLVRITFEQMVDFYKKIYPDSTLINTEKGILESIDSASSEMEEAKTSDLGYSVEDAELYEGKFYIYKRMETHYDDRQQSVPGTGV